jgi:hypothetical protein
MRRACFGKGKRSLRLQPMKLPIFSVNPDDSFLQEGTGFQLSRE